MKGAAFIGGVMFGILVVVLVWALFYGGPLEKCERENNVYQCEYVAVPIDPEHIENE